MKFVVSTTDTFKVIFQNIKAFADDVVIHFGPEGLYMQGMDNGMCCCFELKLPVLWFEHYEGAAEQFGGACDGHSSEDFSSPSRLTENPVLSDTGSDMRNIVYWWRWRPRLVLWVPLMDIEQELLQFESMRVRWIWRLVTRNFRAGGWLKMFDERVCIKFTDEAVVVESKGIEGSMRTDITADDVLEYAIGGLAFDQEYSLEF